jgi:outer membrane protein OmpA-like peptidoglycan-associated protein
MTSLTSLARAGAALTLAAVATASLTACTTNTGTAIDDKRVQGAVLGTLAGAAAGAAVDDHKRGRGAAIGAVVGGVSGGLIGAYLEKQKEEIDAIPGAEVEQVGDSLMVRFDNAILFDTGSRSVSPGAMSRLDSLAETLVRYPDTYVVITGHTDAEGSEEFNQRLSEDRAYAVRDHLATRGVSRDRMTANGRGESLPLATNSTPEGRAQNRRVEIEIKPNERLREQQSGGTN